MGSYDWTTNNTLYSIFDMTNSLTIPEYQREYSWGRPEAEDFYDDLVRFEESGEDKYLFGQLIFLDKKDRNSYDIIDGQQRLVTTVIFMSVARNIAKDLGISGDDDVDEFKTWVRNTIGNEKHDTFKLTLGGRAETYFRNNIQRSGGPAHSGPIKATKNIYSVYKLFEERLKKTLEDIEDNENKFEKIYILTKCLLNKYLLSKIITHDLSQAYTIFETLNSRGKDLEPSDLLKNYFFNKGGDSIKSTWEDMTDLLKQENESVTQYIRTYWNSRHRIVRQRQLYRTISNEIQDRKAAIGFVEGLNANVGYYLSLTSPADYDEFKDPKIKSALINLKTLKAKLFYPVVLACVGIDAGNKEIRSFLNTVEILIVRNNIIGQKVTNRMETLFAQLANDITDGRISVSDAISTIRDETDDDATFVQNFKTATSKNAPISRYLLSTMYNFDNPSEFIINPDPRSVNLEHIMPQCIKKWNVNKSDHETYLNYIGNQTLLRSEDNTSASDDEFDKKKETYAKSKLPQNRDYFKDIPEWGSEQILERQEKLADIAVRCWPRG